MATHTAIKPAAKPKAKLMRVCVTSRIRDAEHNHYPWDTPEVPESVAKAWIDAGLAQEIHSGKSETN